MSKKKKMSDFSESELFEAFKNDLFIILLEKLGGSIDLTVDEVDNMPRNKVMMMECDPLKGFHFENVTKQ